MATHYVSAFRPLAKDPLLSDGSETLDDPLFQFFKHVEARLELSGPDSVESCPGYMVEDSPSHELSSYFPCVTSVADEHTTPPQSL